MREASPLLHATADDPPLLLTYAGEPSEAPFAADAAQKDWIHHVCLGLPLKVKYDALGCECELYHRGRPAGSGAEIAFLKKHLLGSTGASLPKDVVAGLLELATLGPDKPLWLAELGPLARADFWRSAHADFARIPRLRGFNLWLAHGLDVESIDAFLDRHEALGIVWTIRCLSRRAKEKLCRACVVTLEDVFSQGADLGDRLRRTRPVRLHEFSDDDIGN